MKKSILFSVMVIATLVITVPAVLLSCGSGSRTERPKLTKYQVIHPVQGVKSTYNSIDSTLVSGDTVFHRHSAIASNARQKWVIVHKLSESISGFYDGEGNPIPRDVVVLLVRSQFVVMTPEEQARIKEYFPVEFTTQVITDKKTANVD